MGDNYPMGMTPDDFDRMQGEHSVGVTRCVKNGEWLGYEEEEEDDRY